MSRHIARHAGRQVRRIDVARGLNTFPVSKVGTSPSLRPSLCVLNAVGAHLPMFFVGTYPTTYFVHCLGQRMSHGAPKLSLSA